LVLACVTSWFNLAYHGVCLLLRTDVRTRCRGSNHSVQSRATSGPSDWAETLLGQHPGSSLAPSEREITLRLPEACVPQVSAIPPQPPALILAPRNVRAGLCLRVTRLPYGAWHYRAPPVGSILDSAHPVKQSDKCDTRSERCSAAGHRPPWPHLGHSRTMIQTKPRGQPLTAVRATQSHRDLQMVI